MIYYFKNQNKMPFLSLSKYKALEKTFDLVYQKHHNTLNVPVYRESVLRGQNDTMSC